MQKGSFLISFGNNEMGQLCLGNQPREPPEMLKEPFLTPKFSRISFHVCLMKAGRSHVLLLSLENKLYACGSNQKGQLGTGKYSKTSTTEPVLVRMEHHKRVSDVFTTDASCFYTSGTFKSHRVC